MAQLDIKSLTVEMVAMEAKLQCYSCIRAVGLNINFNSAADICVLSNVVNDEIRPICIHGTNKNIFANPRLLQWLLVHIRTDETTNLMKPCSDVRLLKLPPDIAKIKNVNYHLQIPLLLKSGIEILVSLFYKDFNNLKGEQVQIIIESIRYLEPAFNMIFRTDSLPNFACEPYFEKMIGHSPQMHNVFKTISAIAPSDANVLIYGETGTGKELIARAIHNKSLRKEEKFIPVDCVAIPNTLIESELFGFEKGAFTGALSKKFGLLEFSNNGTLFLDEISELDTNIQAKLLRVIQERQFRRIGGSELINLNVRIIAATNRKPTEAMATGHLREDLFYRLSVIPIKIPPLRQRKQDIPLLANHFLKNAAKKNRRETKQISKEAMHLLIAHRWSGNVRELENIIERVFLLSQGPVIDVDDLPYAIQSSPNDYVHSDLDVPLKQARERYLKKFEKKYIQNVLEKSSYNIKKAAQIASVSSRTMYRMLVRTNSEKNLSSKRVS